MSSELQISKEFSFDGHHLRTLEVDGKTAWVAVDVARALGYKVPDQAVRDTCKVLCKRKVLSRGGEQETYIIFEPDLYRLVMKCKLPSAQRFEKWVFEEVLPSIRKTGSYSPTPTTMGIPEAIVATGLELRRLADAQDEMNQRLERLEKNLTAGVEEIKQDHAARTGRREFPESTRREFVTVLKTYFAGRCPISGEVLVDRDGNVDWSVAHVDHWNGHGDNTRNNGWIVSKAENMKMKDPAYRAQQSTHWLFWSQKMNPNKIQQLGFNF
jgi:prophage antirepressor-like protein